MQLDNGSKMIARHAYVPRCGKGFTLIELVIVVVIIAVITGLVLPAVIAVRDEARAGANQSSVAIVPRAPYAFSEAAGAAPALSGSRPVIDSLDLRMDLASSYHRIGMDVYTRYAVDCTGRVVFGLPPGAEQGRLLLVVLFPDEVVEARDVDLHLLSGAEGKPHAAEQIAYRHDGIYCSVTAQPGQPLTAEVHFTALGRERFDYRLPPAQQLQSAAITLHLRGAESITVPDEALQPTAANAEELQWNFHNLVSDRQIIVLIPGAQSPVARVLLLLKLIAIAVLFFGAGFWYLSEQARPGQLDNFRLGHFLLLALTYCLFFAIFIVLEFHGALGTAVSMLIATVFSLPLLVLHVSRVLDTRFALTRVVPLAAFSLALVINGVYGGAIRDYVFVAAVAVLIGYVTITYPAWAASRERHRREKQAVYAAGRAARTGDTAPKATGTAGDGEVHCAACGQRVPDAPFCQLCGVPRAARVACPGCGERTSTPTHLLAPANQPRMIYCTRCGTRLPDLPANSDSKSIPAPPGTPAAPEAR